MDDPLKVEFIIETMICGAQRWLRVSSSRNYDIGRAETEQKMPLSPSFWDPYAIVEHLIPKL